MDKIIDLLNTKEDFQVFIDENMKLSTYVPLWKKEISEVEFSANQNFSTYTAEYGKAIAASMIEKNAEKPLLNYPTAGKISGSIGRMGNRWQLDNDRLRTMYEMEGRFRDRSASYTAERRSAEWLKLVKFFFDSFEMAAIAPHKRLDLLVYEGISNGTLTIELANNPLGIQYDPIDLGVKKFGTLGAVWNQQNAINGTMHGMQDLRAFQDLMQASGRSVIKFRMTRVTFNQLAYSFQYNDSIKLNLGKISMNPEVGLSLADVNTILAGADIAPIQLESQIIAIDEDTDVNAFHDNRIVAVLGENVAKMIVSEPLEAIDPVPGKIYTQYEDNWISSYRDNNGRYVENEMWASPIFSNTRNIGILKTDRTQAQVEAE